MKTYQCLILLIFINFIYSDKSYCDGTKQIPTNPSKAEDCNAFDHDGGHCCLVKAKGKNYCSGFGPNEYKAIPEMVKLSKKCYDDNGDGCVEFKDYSIECKSSFLTFSLLGLILIFL